MFMREDCVWAVVTLALVLALVVVGQVAAAQADDRVKELYTEAREELRNEKYRGAAAAFRSVFELYPESAYAPDALYWEAFALQRVGGKENLRAAMEALELQKSRYPDAATRGDAVQLATIIAGELAQRGDAEAAEEIARRIAQLVSEQAEEALEEAQEAAQHAHETQQVLVPLEEDVVMMTEVSELEDEHIRVAAIEALMFVDADRAVPVLRKVLERRDEKSSELRERAVFILSQKETDETEGILLSVVRTDPDPEVKGQALFWLSQVRSEEVLDAITEVLENSDDPDLQENAVFALSQHPSPRAGKILKDVALDETASPKAREQAIFWLGKKHSAGDLQFLQQLYDQISDLSLLEQIVFAIAQQSTDASNRWLRDIALSEDEPTDLRTTALFWLGRVGAISSVDLAEIYDSVQDREMREQVIFGLSQRGDSEAIDKLFEIAREETDSELRRSAIFWIGHSNDPRAGEFLEELITQ